MLSRQIKRVCLDTRWTPPTFLLPWVANLTTVSHTPAGTPDALFNAARQSQSEGSLQTPQQSAEHTLRDQQQTRAAVQDQRRVATSTAALNAPELPSSSSTPEAPMQLSHSVKDLLPLLRSQGSYYITAHLYDRPYLLTQGDTLRLPFLMHGVEPGDVLRLDKASNIGSRDYTLKAAAMQPPLKSNTTSTVAIQDPTSGTLASESRVMPEAGLSSTGSRILAPHFIPHIAKGKMPYLDDRLYVCRAVVMGVEAEPMRIKEKTKRRQRRVKTVHSKHKFTVLKIKEVRLRSEEEIANGDID